MTCIDANAKIARANNFFAGGSIRRGNLRRGKAYLQDASRRLVSDAFAGVSVKTILRKLVTILMSLDPAPRLSHEANHNFRGIPMGKKSLLVAGLAAAALTVSPAMAASAQSSAAAKLSLSNAVAQGRASTPVQKAENYNRSGTVLAVLAAALGVTGLVIALQSGNHSAS